MVTKLIIYHNACLKVSKRVYPKSSHDKKKILFITMLVTDVNWTYYGGYFTMYTDIQSLCCMPETDIMYIK